jgi:hypothetical protein
MKERSCRFEMRLTIEGFGMIDALAVRWRVDRTAAVMRAVTEAWARGRAESSMVRGRLVGGKMVKSGSCRGGKGARKGGRT